MDTISNDKAVSHACVRLSLYSEVGVSKEVKFGLENKFLKLKDCNRIFTSFKEAALFPIFSDLK